MENPYSPTGMTDSYVFFKSDGGEDPVPDPNSLMAGLAPQLTADFAPTPRCYGSYSSVKIEDVKDMTPEDLDRRAGQVLPGRGSSLSSHVPAACREAVRRTEERLQRIMACERQKLEETLEWAADAASRASSWADCKRRAGRRPWWDGLPVERPDKPWRSDIYDEWHDLWRRLDQPP